MDLQNKAILWSEPELVGWVEMRGDRSTTWDRRFLLLQGPNLFYYIRNTDIPTMEPEGVIPLEEASIKVEEDNSDTGRQFCFVLQLGYELSTLAKHRSYHISAPSQEANIIWMHGLKMASYSLAFVIRELQDVQEKAHSLSLHLAKSPSGAKELQYSQGYESNVLQKEIKKMNEIYEKLKVETIETCTQADKVNDEAIQFITIWEVYRDHISGKNQKDNCYTTCRLNAEAKIIKNLYEILIAKKDLIIGKGIKNLPLEVVEDLNAICTKGLSNINERQFQRRINGPNYTLSVHPALLPEGCDDLISRVSHCIDIHKLVHPEESKKNSTSLQMLKENTYSKNSLITKAEEHELLKSNEESFKSIELKQSPQNKETNVINELNKTNIILNIQKNNAAVEKKKNSSSTKEGGIEDKKKNVVLNIEEDDSKDEKKKMILNLEKGGIKDEKKNVNLYIAIDSTKDEEKNVLLNIEKKEREDKKELIDVPKFDRKEMAHQVQIELKNIEKIAINQSRFQKIVLQNCIENWLSTSKQPPVSLSI